MTAPDFLAALARLDLSQVAAASLLGVDKQTVHRWAKGTRAVPPPVSRFLRFMIAANIKPARVEQLLAD